MPGIAQKISAVDASCDNNGTSYQNSSAGNGKPAFHSFNGSSTSRNGFWSQHRDLSHSQLQKFWCELSPQARRKLLRIDKQALSEHARKNMYCSRCNGLLLEGFTQIVMYGKSLEQDAADSGKELDLCMDNECHDVVPDPLVHPWGGLATAKDGTLTLLDCYLCSKSLNDIQNVFDSARARERERELLYPDACGGGGRGWISQGVAGYGGRGHGTRETCALHTARLSVETLLDFWSALGEETRQSLLRMKEEDFIDRLMYRFESKRFCRDCRRNVIREFKELKELKRMRKQTRCTSWFCVADTDFQCEVSNDTVQADWHQTFSEASGKYHHFEWGIGSGEGKCDILEFENVGLSRKVQVNGLDLIGLNTCYITLRAWRIDGRCNELCVKAHALRGQQCVHRRLAVGDGILTIARGESITDFFELAEEIEEEEDDDSLDKDGNDLDVECTRPQKHAKSPELAREFLLDAATVIFKEQVEKAFREGTARQNAHSIFVCLSLNLLEESIYVACKDIITLEKQTKLLEEEEKEKKEEEERKERKRTKEREKKLRRKERLREKENREKKCVEQDLTDVVKEASVDQGVEVDSDDERDEASQSQLLSPDIQDTCSNTENLYEDILDEELDSGSDWNTPFSYDQNKCSRRKQRFHKDSNQDSNLKWHDRKRGPTNASRYDSNSCIRSHHHTDHRSRSGPQITRGPQPYHRGKKSNHAQTKIVSGNIPKKVWEPLDSKKKCIRSNSDSDITLRSSTLKVDPSESGKLHESCSPSSDDALVQTNQEDNDARDSTGSVTKPQDSSTSTSSNSDNFFSCVSDGTSTSDSEETSDSLKNPGCTSQPRGVLPQINYPVFHHHQNPVNGPIPIPFPHSNRYLFPNGFRYGAFQNLINAPVFHPVSQVSTNSTGLKEANRTTPKDRVVDDKTDVGNNGFSLFHFGGPIALSTGFKPDQIKEYNCTDGKHPCGKEDNIKEYNLFAATKGIISFSIV